MNKDRPELQCNGQCHLKKTMKNDDEQKQEQNRTQHEAQQVTLWGGEEALDMEPAVSDVLANPVIYLLKDHDPFCGSFFQPPRLTA